MKGSLPLTHAPLLALLRGTSQQENHIKALRAYFIRKFITFYI